MDIVIYHGNCPDGFCAAFVAKKAFPNAQFIPAVHGAKLPLEACRDKDVLVVDFSWKRWQVEDLKAVTKSLVILDHHASAEKELAGLPYAQFDMNRSGAAMCWDYLFPVLSIGGIYRPWYVNYVQDRDLWRWAMPASREVSAYIMATPMTFEAWAHFDKMGVEDALAGGVAIVQHINHYIEKVTEQAQWGWFGGHKVAVVNAAYPNISDVCNKLCEQGAHIGMGWFQRYDALVQFSLRSIGDLDVSEIAKAYGGGGHKNAAGFQLPLHEALAVLEQILS